MMQNIYDAVEVATQLNMYIIIDWHGLDESERYDKQPAPDGSTFSRADPLIYLPEAIDFFEEFSAAFADHDNVIYELYNEPLSGKDLYPDDFEAAYTYAWDRIKTQADALIPIIRENDPNAVIFVGTPLSGPTARICNQRPRVQKQIQQYSLYGSLLRKYGICKRPTGQQL